MNLKQKLKISLQAISRQKVIILILCTVIFNFTTQAKKKHISRHQIIENTSLIIEQETSNYIDQSYKAFSEEIDKESGFLSWKNYRDYCGLGNESLKNKSVRIWNTIYKSSIIEEIIYLNLEESYIFLGENPAKITINLKKTKDIINIYPQKILLGVGIFVIEEALELALSTILSFILISIIVNTFIKYKFKFGIWKRWSKKRRDKIEKKTKRLKFIAGTLSFIVFFFLTALFSMNENDAMKFEIKKKFLEEIRIQIDNNLQ